MNLLVIVIDRLHLGYLGPYGNAWVVTPAFNRLAAESFTFDTMISDRPDLQAWYRAAWTGRHALEPAQPLDAEQSLPAILRRAGLPMTVLTDDPQLDTSWAGDKIERVDLPTPRASTAETSDDTHLAEVFAATIDQLAEACDGQTLWLHTQALGTAWDAPLDEYRNRYAEEDEAPPPPVVAVPRLVLAEGYDPDELFGLSLAYAGQVRLLDECLAGLLEYLDESPAGRETLLVVTSPRGIAMGAHRLVGAWDETLHGETIRLPLIVRFGDGLGRACRSQAIVQPPDLFATIVDAIGLSASRRSIVSGASAMPVIRGEAENLRDRAMTLAASEQGLRTPSWYLRMDDKPDSTRTDDPSRELYAMPDDRWEANDIATRAPEVVELLEQAATELARRAGNDSDAPLSELAEVLSSPIR
jgi:arylsulfatase A-like enzyme